MNFIGMKVALVLNVLTHMVSPLLVSVFAVVWKAARNRSIGFYSAACSWAARLTACPLEQRTLSHY